MTYVNNLFTFFQGLLRLISLQYRLSFIDFFTWIALGYVDLRFSRL